jgi:ferredoxin-type protein NapG
MSKSEGISRRDLFRGRVSARREREQRERESRRVAFPVHRPPGACEEEAFLRDCTRCDACVEVCPHDAIVHAPPRFRQAAGTPMIDAANQPCLMCDDTPCIDACEPGVLSRHLPLAMATATITPQTCLAHQGTTCTVCVEQCPVDGAIEMRDHRPHIIEDKCTGCGVCHYVCPAPANAVIVMPLPERPPRPFPHMNQAELSNDEVGQLLNDIDQYAELLLVNLKSNTRSFTPEQRLGLEDARAAIESRSARGVQLRYRYEGDEWWDTLMLQPDGARLVRVRHDFDKERP